MKFVYGFFMAWGNFMTIPCPCKIWDGKAKNAMIGFLPIIGLIIGLLWMGLLWLLNWLLVPALIVDFIMIFYIFAICGFMHMDGFMDCNDAILSRRPLEDRQRILKDSTVGAFAVVTVVFLIVAWFASMYTALYKFYYMPLMIIPVISRSMSALGVLTYKPIGHSQYVEAAGNADRKPFAVAVLLEMLIFTAGAYFIDGMNETILICAGVTVLASLTAMTYARKDLGGMSGDISGYAICLSELAGITALAII